MPSSRKWANWIYWPSRPEYAVPWTLGPAIFLLMGALGFAPSIGQRMGLAVPNASTSIIWIIVASLLNYGLLFSHIRSAYLTGRFATLPTLGTLILLSALYTLAWGIWLVWHGEIEFALLSSVTAKTDVTFHVIATGLQVLTAALLLSTFWKTHEPKVADVVRLREIALPLLKKRENLSQVEYGRLTWALDELPKNIRAVGRVTAREQGVLDAWEIASLALYRKISSNDPRDLRLFEGDEAVEVAAHIRTLNST